MNLKMLFEGWYQSDYLIVSYQMACVQEIIKTFIFLVLLIICVIYLLNQIKKPMSADNMILIDKKTYTVYYLPCVSNDYKKKLRKFRSLEEAVNFAEKFIIKQLDGYLEYGIRFV